MIKYLVLDVDDTLIKKGKVEVEESAIKAIQMCKDNGIKVIVATGRGFKFLQKDIKNRVKADYYVMVNGGCINDTTGKTLVSYPLTKENTDRLIEVCYQKGYPFGFKFDDTLQVYSQWEKFTDLYCNKAITIDTLDDNTQTNDYHITHGLPLDCFMFSENREAMELKDDFPDLYFYPASKYGAECFPMTVNKGKTIKWLVESNGDTLENCLAIGDSENDIEMLQMCGIGVAMGNSVEATKEIADYVTTDILEDGVYNALKHFNLI